MSEYARYRATLRLRECWLCLELCNATVDWHAGEHPIEHIQGYSDLVAWGIDVGLLGPEASAEVNSLAAEEPRMAGEAMNRLLNLRETCYRTFAEIAHHRTPVAGDVAELNRFLARSLSAAAVAPAGDGFIWSWQAIDLDWALWPTIVRSVAGEARRQGTRGDCPPHARWEHPPTQLSRRVLGRDSSRSTE